MPELIGKHVGRVLIKVVGTVIVGSLSLSGQQRRSKKSISSSQKLNRSLLTQFLASSDQHGRAVLVASSNITFGNDCQRFVNIAFQASQTFPTIMGTYGHVDEYLRKELAKQYPNEYFHIIIGRNKKFGYSIDDDQYFAEIEQKRYRVLIFISEQNCPIKLDTHDVNSQKLFVWN